MKLNKSNVDAIVLTEKGQAIHRDSDLIGFAVRATTKSKSYIVERRHEGKLYRVTIGKTNEITPVEAKKRHKPFWLILPMVNMKRRKKVLMK